MDNPWFFLSHAKRDNMPDGYCKRFFDKLTIEIAKAVALKSNVDAQECGFFDETSIETGDLGDLAMAKALQTCRALVCLYSPSYFASDWCGREFEIFSQRIEAHTNAQEPAGVWPPLVLPILWSRPENLPNPLPLAVSRVQFKNDHFSEIYRKEGLEYIIRLAKGRLEYEAELEQFVMDFANRLKDVARAHIIASLPKPIRLEAVKSAFHPEVEPVPDVALTTMNEGMNIARFVCLAGRRDEVQGIKQKAEHYSPDGGRFWTPYYPEYLKNIGADSAKIAGDENLQPEYLAVDRELVSRIREAESNNTLVILFIDPWTIRIDTYKACMAEYDQYRFKNCGILVLWNEKDEETRQQQDALKHDLGNILGRNLEEHNPHIRHEIRSPEEFEKELRVVIAQIRGRLLTKGNIHRPVEVGQVLPLVSGPGAFSP